MSAKVADAIALMVDVISEVICPWCFVALRLDNANRSLAGQHEGGFN